MIWRARRFASRCHAMSSNAPPTVWLAPLPDDLPTQAIDACLAVLDAGERDRAERFKVAGAKGQYIVAHAFTRLALSATVPEIAPAAWSFDRGADGKPFVTGGPQFSLSHTAGLVGCAVWGGGEIGFDVEAWDRRVDLSTMSAVLTEAESLQLSSLNAEQQRRQFFELWTAKEACAKACGRGIAVGLRKIHLHGEAGDLRATGVAGDWRITQQSVGERHLFALAIATAGMPVVRQLLLDDLAKAARPGRRF